MALRSYFIGQRTRALRESPQHIDFHIRTGDYFSYLATMIGFLEDELTADDASETTRKLVRDLRMDLRYMQANYKIAPRALGDIQVIRPSGNLMGRERI